MDAPARILGKQWSGTASLPSGGQLPRELSETAARRLGVLTVLTASTLVVFGAAHLTAAIATRDRTGGAIALGSLATAIVFSIIMFGLTRSRQVRPHRLLAAALVYQLAMAVAIGVLDNLSTPQHGVGVRGWSGLAVWIFIFAVFIPSTPRRTLRVSALIALLDPLTMLLDAALGIPLPPLVLMPQLFAPTLVAVVTAVIAAHINYRTAKKLHAARELGSYRLVKLLGQGGMGEVWRAEHRMLARPAAIKLIRAELLAGNARESAETALRRFEREAQATALMQSEHTIEVYDFGTSDDGSFYYVMELLDGLNLEDLVRRNGPMPPARVVHCLRGICDSLAEAHGNGLIHRDIKPSNVFLCRRGLSYDCVKVLDFGLVTPAADAVGEGETLPNQIVGTPAYMAPEIIEGGEVDGRADLYAVGCLAYFLLSGHPVFDSPNATAVIMQHLSADPPRLQSKAAQPIPPALEQIVHSCLAKEPAGRPSSAADLCARLDGVEPGAPWSQDEARCWWQAARAAAQAVAAVADTAAQTVRPGVER